MIATIIPSRTDAHIRRLLASMESMQPGWVTRHPSDWVSLIIIIDSGLSKDLKDEYAPYRNIRFVRYTREEFVFSAAMNLGVRWAPQGADLLLMNDDTEFLSPAPLEAFELAVPAMLEEQFGLVSPVIEGGVGNPDQRVAPSGRFAESAITICFICVLIPRVVWYRVGPMDEQFIGYGFDDSAFNRSVRAAGWKTGVMAGVRLFHDQHGTFIPVFGSDELTRMYHANRARFEAKWGPIGDRPAG